MDFDGIVMTDWAAMAERPRALKAGLELEMPTSFGENDRRIVAAVRKGVLEESVLNEAVRRLLRWIDWCLEAASRPLAPEKESAEALARRAAGECAVLLKNNGTLPLKQGQKIAFIGGFAQTPRFQGGGSSNVQVRGVVGALQAAREQKIGNIVYAEGFNTVDDRTDPSSWPGR